MKKLMAIIVLAIMLMASQLWAAGSCTQTAYSTSNPTQAIIKFVCTGAADNGSVPDTATSAANTAFIDGMYLYTVSAYPTSGGTAPDAADVFILDANGEDLLGSVDGGTTANKGLNLIHATLKKTTMPYSAYLGNAYYPAITGGLTVKVANQATPNANFTIELTCVR